MFFSFDNYKEIKTYNAFYDCFLLIKIINLKSEIRIICLTKKPHLNEKNNINYFI